MVRPRPRPTRLAGRPVPTWSRARRRSRPRLSDSSPRSALTSSIISAIPTCSLPIWSRAELRSGVTMASPAGAQPSSSSPNLDARERAAQFAGASGCGCRYCKRRWPAPAPPRDRGNPDARSRNRRYSAHGFSARKRERSIALAKNARWRFNCSRSRSGHRSAWPEFRTSETTSEMPEHNPCADNESRASDASPTLSGAAGPALH